MANAKTISVLSENSPASLIGFQQEENKPSIMQQLDFSTYPKRYKDLAYMLNCKQYLSTAFVYFRIPSTTAVCFTKPG